MLLWRRFVGPTAAGSPLRVAQNSLFPLSSSLFNRLLDLGFFVVLLRALGPQGVGQYTGAIAYVGYFEVFVHFGLGTLLIREVARDATQCGRYFWNSLVLRIALWAAFLPVLYLLVQPLAPTLGLTSASAAALALFVLGILPGQVSGSVSSVLIAFERNSIPAALAVFTNLVRVVLGLAVLGLGMPAELSIAGLAGVSVIVNLITMIALVWLTWRVVERPRWSFDVRFCWWMARESYPLMLNSLLNTIFFRVDVVILQAFAGPTVVGYYSTAYRFIDGLNVISSNFVLAVFPIMSRQVFAPDKLRRIVSLSVRVLLTLAFPICFGMFMFAEPLVLSVGGEEYLPHSAFALQALIWFLPLSFVNGLFQYVLIAVNRQKLVTVAFLIASSFNLVVNLMLIPYYGYVAAATTTVLSEAVLLIPFAWGVRTRVELPPLFRLSWRPLLASLVMAMVLYPLLEAGLVLILLGAGVYALALAALYALGAEERALARAAIAIVRRRR